MYIYMQIVLFFKQVPYNLFNKVAYTETCNLADLFKDILPLHTLP